MKVVKVSKSSKTWRILFSSVCNSWHCLLAFLILGFFFCQLFRYATAQFPKQRKTSNSCKIWCPLPIYSCSFSITDITKHGWFVGFFSFVPIYLCFLLFLAYWMVCWLALRQEKCAGKWHKNATQMSLKYFGNSVAGARMSPSAISMNCFSSFPSWSVSCINKEWV